MASTPWQYTRDVSINASGTYSLDHSIASNTEVQLMELFISSNTNGIVVEILYSEDSGQTWMNPNDPDADKIIKAFIAAAIPVHARPYNAVLPGGANVIARFKLTNPTGNTASVFFIIKGTTHNVD